METIYYNLTPLHVGLDVETLAGVCLSGAVPFLAIHSQFNHTRFKVHQSYLLFIEFFERHRYLWCSFS